jgi:uncharacterized protein (TIGR02145 family)
MKKTILIVLLLVVQSSFSQIIMTSFQGVMSSKKAVVVPKTTVTIDTQVWTTKNLDVATYSDGTDIPQVTDPEAWASLTTGAWCYYNNDSANGAIYGKLYNWYAVAGIHDEASKTDASKRKKLAPTGFHVPTDTEWTTLIQSSNYKFYYAGIYLNSNVGGHWAESKTAQGALNSSGFTGLPGGYRANDFRGINYTVFWWSSTGTIKNAFIFYTYEASQASFSNLVSFAGCSVRLVKNTVPNAPTITDATAGNKEATVSFTAPTSDGGSAITEYTVTSSPGGVTATGTTSPIVVAGLTNGTDYTFTVVATNAVGNSVASEVSESIWAASEVITQINIENQSPTFYADGDKGTIDGTEPRLKYTNTNSKINWYFYAPTTDITVAELKSIYYIASKTDKRAPFIFIYTKKDQLTSNLGSWYKSRITYERATSTLESDNSEYYAIAKATVKYGLTGLELSKNLGGQDKVTDNELTENILYIGIGTDSSAPAGDYNFSLLEMGIEKKSGSREIFKFTTNSSQKTVPGAPTITAATAGNTQATVSFTVPTSDGGSAITEYTVTSSPASSPATFTGTTSPIVVTGLTNGTSYTFTVVATNEVGNSVASDASETVTPFISVPDAPTSPVATAGFEQASVAFTAPASDGGSAITEYTVTSSPGDLTATGTTSPIVVTGLANGTSYTFTVVATNEVGNSDASGATTAVIPAATIGLHPELGGYVFFVSDDGHHGLVSETQDQGTSNWYDAGSFVSNPKNHSVAGKKFTDWRVPTRGELSLMYNIRNSIGGFIQNYYWTTESYKTQFAYIESFLDNLKISSFVGKSSIYSNRGVRSF